MQDDATLVRASASVVSQDPVHMHEQSCSMTTSHKQLFYRPEYLHTKTYK